MDDKLQKILDQMSDYVQISYARSELTGETHPETGEDLVKGTTVVLQFSKKGFGFGEITIVTDLTTQETYIDSECMGRDRVKQFLCDLVDRARLDTDKE